jgi:hypothetical protein
MIERGPIIIPYFFASFGVMGDYVGGVEVHVPRTHEPECRRSRVRAHTRRPGQRRLCSYEYSGRGRYVPAFHYGGY